MLPPLIEGIVITLLAVMAFAKGREEGMVFKSGTSIDEALETAAAAGLGGLEFLAGMPGTIGGAV
ncbi:MAG: hypothetical protein LBG24_07515 [Treponema sp.]|jgi:UDP-N-acetylmuramate dehydrogenase|nr:hypothetical protein [Treponema sp.]